MAEFSYITLASSSLEVLSLPAEDIMGEAGADQYNAMDMSLLERSTKEDLNASREEEPIECSDWQPLDPVR